MQILGQVVAGFVMGVTIIFITLNMMVGCNDWTQERCITPLEMLP
jgi:hypothetical protein